jgi:hypothetical protein
MKHVDVYGLDQMMKSCSDRHDFLFSRLKGTYKKDLIMYVKTLTYDNDKKPHLLTKKELCKYLVDFAETKYTQQRLHVLTVGDKMTKQKRKDIIKTEEKCKSAKKRLNSYRKGCFTKKCKHEADIYIKLAEDHVDNLQKIRTCKYPMCPSEYKATEMLHDPNMQCNLLNKFVDTKKQNIFKRGKKFILNNIYD